MGPWGQFPTNNSDEPEQIHEIKEIIDICDLVSGGAENVGGPDEGGQKTERTPTGEE